MLVEIKDIILKITGNRVAVGDEIYDNKVFKGLDVAREIVYPILRDLMLNAERIKAPQCSVQKVGAESLNILKSIYEDIENTLEQI